MLEKDGVYLRLLSGDDLERTYIWMNDPEIMAALSRHVFVFRGKQQKWFASLADDKSKFVFAICLVVDDSHIGNVSLSGVNYINRNCRYSIFLGDGKHRGKGYGRIATELIMDYAFDYLNLHKVYLKTSSTNSGAVKLYEKLGFVKEGVLHEQEFINGKYVDKILFAFFKNSRKH